jgi:membrane associated rhomboid family serine protease
MLGLFFFGMALEDDMGSWEFLLYYNVTGVLAGLASLAIDLATGQMHVFLMGASGAIFAVILGFAAFRPQARVLIFFVIPLRARSMVILYTAIEVFSQIFNPYEGVAHLTHLAGFAFGFLYLLVRFRLNAWKSFWL